ncbi:MAG: hypothetical protein ACKO7W_04145 [Elainella sp.]
MQRRFDRNRKRSQRRAIFCPVHPRCYLDSVSAKYALYADSPEQLQQRGVGRKLSLLLTSNQTAVPLEREWLEGFWCKECQQSEWYHVKKTGDRSYEVAVAPAELWHQATGVIDPRGNPSVGEFTRRQARMLNLHSNRIKKEFGFF